MVKRYTRTDPENDLQIVKDGSFCAYSDYLILAAALKEALDSYQVFVESVSYPLAGGKVMVEPILKGIAELRKLIED